MVRQSLWNGRAGFLKSRKEPKAESRKDKTSCTTQPMPRGIFFNYFSSQKLRICLTPSRVIATVGGEGERSFYLMIWFFAFALSLAELSSPQLLWGRRSKRAVDWLSFEKISSKHSRLLLLCNKYPFITVNNCTTTIAFPSTFHPPPYPP